ncbi:LuxR family transcriptional regulator [Bradyrhizobium sp. CCBAU 51745]|uniref:helix-turn-helix transcriptional regulator n=1 Tax=Bradyrhizobium sp. CCBAU 51745 TaxID=1325099 RepID=UPI00230514A0|nr:helix-turn-helix transcriptional regulator [Bradyrhizobium sp. CCBAU 51745]MDA9440770.1 LuxR family transcriptional regulator [Bradyrhizobium sp. CCBAU 51745]
MADVDEKEVVLSERERQCLRWVEKGKSSWSIGVILNVSENTVNFHIKNAMGKLETSTRTQCVVKARRLGLI